MLWLLCMVIWKHLKIYTDVTILPQLEPKPVLYLVFVIPDYPAFLSYLNSFFLRILCWIFFLFDFLISDLQDHSWDLFSIYTYFSMISSNLMTLNTR